MSLENKINYYFLNSNLLKEALTHPSFDSKFNNQRLEFLGDSIIQIIVTNKIYHSFTNYNEGDLSKLRSQLVSKDALFLYSKKINLKSHILIGKSEEDNGGRNNSSIISDAFEALFGAIYIDSNLEFTQSVFLNNFSDLLFDITKIKKIDNPKGDLQEFLQSIRPITPKYYLISQSGPSHNTLFTCEVIWNDIKLGIGKGSNKKEAEKNAALNVLKKKDKIKLFI